MSVQGAIDGMTKNKNTRYYQRKQKRRKQILRRVRYASVGIVAVALLAAIIVLAVKGIGKLRNNEEKPGGATATPVVTAEATPTEKPAKTPTAGPTQEVGKNTPTPENWDVSQTPAIVQMTAEGDSVTVEFEGVEGAGGYELGYRVADGEWTTVTVAAGERICGFPVNPGTVYSVRIRAIGPYQEIGAFSEEKTVTSLSVEPVLALRGSNRLSADFTVSGIPEGMAYVVRYKASDEEDWNIIPCTENAVSIGALTAGRQYDAEAAVVLEGRDDIVSEQVHFTPEDNGFGDPFKNAYGILNAGGEKKSVGYTAPDGCLGVNCWMEFPEGLYADAELTEKTDDIEGGTAMRISADKDGNYVCALDAARYGVHVTLEKNGTKTEGWVLGNAILVDLAMIFPQDNMYSIQYNRTNAYSSIFTSGGDAMKVDAESPEDTRYDPLRAEDGPSSLTVTGYNVIGGITGQELPGYGPRDQMPAVLDVAIQLLTAQRNALANGCGLLIYESYRPNQTSKAVYKAMREFGYFKVEVPTGDPEAENAVKLTLANGFFTDKAFTEANFIAEYSNHNKGIALDLTITKYVDTETPGEELPMQTKMHTLDYRGHMDFNGENANLLYSIMTEGTGLIPLRKKQEWWHFELNKNVEEFPCISSYVFASYEL